MLYNILYMKNKNILLLFLCFTFFIQLSLFSEEKIDYLFINSIPIGASVIINDNQTEYKTPCIIKKQDISTYSIKLKKEGYRVYILKKSEIVQKKVNINLVPISFDIYFPERTKFKIGSTFVDGPVYVSKIESGNYDINVIDDKISFTKRSGFLPYEITLGTCAVISFASMITTIALSEYFNYSRYQTKDEKERYFYQKATEGADIAKYISIGATSAFTLSFSIVVIVDAVKQYQNQKKELEISKKMPTTGEDIYYQSALQFLTSGDIERANRILESIIGIYKESPILPVVYYQLGQNNFILGDYEKALKYWDIFLREYPAAEYYDYVIKSIADIYYNKKDYELARTYLDKILFIEDSVSIESIISYKAMLDSLLYYNKKEQKYYDLAEEEFLTLINQFFNSERVDLYFTELIKLYKSNNNIEKLNLLKNKLESLKDINETTKKIIISNF